ncbi:LysR family transcriptional regulator [Methylobacterium sp. BTF04]|uniref:LysR family transcriptional regulator n=1 Tax=Methylobacterium sp. BTF04 TaxID=2708300 RepID=UPI0013D1230E|nr:LysR family transcriptional regulator [Methylobacterium sp. BTF04]NEU13540.1 LysR family transcriptional regulator [Methylobacterium sp. BTF04]
MDNRLGEMEVFVQVARRGSFAAAAKALRQTPSAVSRAVARIEARLGMRLIQRTTRSLRLTDEGETYLLRAGDVLAEVEAIESSLDRGAGEPSGRLRVNVSVAFGLHVLVPVLPDYLAAFPRMSLDLTLTDDVVDLVAARADVAIRVGPLRDTRLRAKRLGASRMVVVASPDYLGRHGPPQDPAELGAHACLNFSFRRSLDSWPFRIDGKVVPHAITGRFYGNSGTVVRAMALRGAGLARLARFHVGPDLAAGHLVPVLERFNPGDAEDIHALYAGSERQSPRLRSFLDYLGERLTFAE